MTAEEHTPGVTPPTTGRPTRIAHFSQRLKVLFLLVGGLALAGGGVAFGVRHALLLDASVRADGRVVALQSKRVRGTMLHAPVVEFHPAGSEAPLRVVAGPGLWPSPFDVGDRVVVAYRVEDPSSAMVVSFWTLWLLPLVMLAFGASCVAAGWHERRTSVSARERARLDRPGG